MRLPDFLRRRRRAPTILMYHRVASVDYDPWELAVSPDNFEQHMAFIAAECLPLKMSAFVDHLHRGTLRPQHVAVTFDDAYVDNLRHARPVLKKYGVPATVFAVSEYVRTGAGFWWDEWTRLTLSAAVPADFTLDLGDRPIRCKWGAAPAPRGWRAWQAPNGERHVTFLEAYAPLQQATVADRDAFFDQLRRRVPLAKVADERSMTASELREHLAEELIELGSHTLTHPPLARVDFRVAAKEIAHSRQELATLFGRNIRGLAYPYGSHDARIVNTVAKCGYGWACTTNSGPVHANGSPHALPRIAVGDWNLDRLRRELRA